MSLVRKLLWIGGTIAWIVFFAVAGFWFRPVSYFNEGMYLHENLTGVASQSITVAGHRVHYLAEGPASGPVVVLVHGLGGSAEDWRSLAPRLTKAGFRVYIPDLPGYGRSEKPADFSYSIPDQAAVVVGFLDALSLKQVDLGGWSMGGWIVQRVAFDHPERIRHLMLFDSAGVYEKPSWDTNLFTPNTPAELDQLNALLSPHPQPIPAFVARDLLRRSRQRAWVIHRALASMLTGHDATDALLPQLKMPVLLVWGAEDHATPLSQGEKIHSLVPQSQFDVIQGCGHLAPLQCAPNIAPAVIGFLNQ
ncbi:MAG: alpha/beta hydrolase [Terracidiphilus sp.]|jgi:pimeloyl-ACP methyl ester carboxylesterase